MDAGDFITVGVAVVCLLLVRRSGQRAKAAEAAAADAVGAVSAFATGNPAVPVNLIAKLTLGMLKKHGFRKTAEHCEREEKMLEEMLLELVGERNETAGRIANPEMLGIDDDERRRMYDVVASIVVVGQLTATREKYRRLANACRNTFELGFRSDLRRRLFVDLVLRLDELHMDALCVLSGHKDWIDRSRLPPGDYRPLLRLSGIVNQMEGIEEDLGAKIMRARLAAPRS